MQGLLFVAAYEFCFDQPAHDLRRNRNTVLREQTPLIL
jgi:hypothetical protein